MTTLEIESPNGTWYLGRDAKDLAVDLNTTTVGEVLTAFHAHMQHKGIAAEYQIFNAKSPAAALNSTSTLASAGIDDGDKLVVVSPSGGGQ